MVNLKDIHPLSEFQRNAKKFIQRLQKSRKPLVLTVNGKAALVIQDAGAYQRLLDQLELALSASTIKERMDKFAHDGVEFDAKEALEQLREELEIPR